jgi:hypothetical protein
MKIYGERELHTYLNNNLITTILILKYTCQQVSDVSTRILIQKQFTYDIYIYIF